MKLRMKHTGYFVTSFVGIALVVFFALLILISVDKKIFSTKHSFYTQFSDAVGLSSSTPVLFKGYNIGRVTNFTLNDENKVDVEILIYEDFLPKIVESSVIRKVLNPITSTSSLEYIVALQESENISIGGFITSYDSFEGRKFFIENRMQRSGEFLFSMLEKMDELLSVLVSQDSLEKSVTYTLLYNLSAMSEDLKIASKNINSTLTAVERMFSEDQSSLNRALEGLAQVSEDLQETTTRINNVAIDADTLLNNYKDPEGLIAKMVDPGGNKLVDPASKLLIGGDKLVTESVKFIEYLNSEAASISLLLEKVNVTLNQLQTTLEGVNNNPLINFGASEKQKKYSDGSKIRIKEIE
ncbi:MAG: MlaD family protein [Ignavibacteriales bacterium]|nr:MlaD family protein [Ignavibacteriales bacterium]MCF8305660.1 MlaD family protein [Ignavibacteriales bacterium]MCF8315382.1 MlaD family protein [Ignavibacteriales bacterium]MCF8436726.1 MlaD family protein [Ignavibacteriales bacterium]